MNSIHQLLVDMPPLAARKDPQIAAFLGFMTGGVGVGLYFRSFIDCLIPLALVFAIGLTVPLTPLEDTMAVLLGAVVAACYGYFRASCSNGQLVE